MAETKTSPTCSWWTNYFSDTAAGYLLYLASGGRLFKPCEELPGYTVPTTFKHFSEVKGSEKAGLEKNASGETSDDKADQAATDVTSNLPSSRSKSLEEGKTAPMAQRKTIARSAIDPDVDEDVALAGGMRGPLRSISMRATTATNWSQGKDWLIVDWYGPDDIANPQNWTSHMKIVFLLVLALLTFSVYAGASIISPGLPYVIQDYGVSNVVADTMIAFYVLGYGLGPLLFSPLSELPAIGRLPMYVIPLTLFFCVGFAAVWTPTFGGLLVSRLLTGFLASPALATGAASVGDILSPINVPYGLCLWVVSAYQGPGLAPIISGYAVQHFGTWRWSLGIYQIMVLICVLVTFFCMPETSGPNILARRAARIRKITGDDRYRSMGEIHQAGLTSGEILREAIIKPFEITIKDPSVAFINIYISFIYAFYYLFFAGFPIIFFELYGFDIGNGELPYLSICVGGSVFCVMYVLTYKYYVVPRIMSGRITEPEQGLDPALPFSIVASISLFCVGWTAGRTHWMAPIIFTGLFAGANFFILQPVFGYLAMTYPVYAASLFAANDSMRSCLAFGLLLAGTPMFRAMGIGPGYSFLGGLLALCVPPLFFLRFYGKKLRERSTFAVSQ